MVQLTDIDIFIIYLLPILFLIASWIWECFIDKNSLHKTMIMSTMVLAFINTFNSFIILKASIAYLSISIVWWAIVLITAWILDAKEEDNAAFWAILLGHGALILFQFYLVVTEFNILDLVF